MAGRPSKQEQIVRAAHALFVEYGYQGTSIDLVVQRAGVSKPTIYNHFPTKQAMLEQLLGDVIGVVQQEINRLIAVFPPASAGAVVELYQFLAATPVVLAALKIRIGEVHKLESNALESLHQLDGLIEDWTNTWLAKLHGRAVIRAVCRDGILFPALLGLPACVIVDPNQWLQQVLAECPK